MTGIMTFLKKAGVALVNAASFVELGYPILGKLVPKGAQSAVGTAVTDLEQFASAVTTIEEVSNSVPSGLTGEQKLVAVLPGIARAVGGSSIMLGKKVQDTALYQKAVQGYAQATVDLLNSLHEDGVVVTPKPQ